MLDWALAQPDPGHMPGHSPDTHPLKSQLNPHFLPFP